MIKLIIIIILKLTITTLRCLPIVKLTILKASTSITITNISIMTKPIMKLSIVKTTNSTPTLNPPFKTKTYPNSKILLK